MKTESMYEEAEIKREPMQVNEYANTTPSLIKMYANFLNCEILSNIDVLD